MGPSFRRVLVAGSLAAVLLLPLVLLGPAFAGTGTPTFTNHVPPGNWGNGGAEPSVGVNWNTGNILTISSLRTLRLNLSSGSPVWADVSARATSVDTLDPILFTDSVTGRTFVSQLAGACSFMAFTDTDGDAWTPIAGGPSVQGGWLPSGGCAPGAMIDHQTVGGGPFPLGLAPPSPAYPHAVYYCSHNGARGMCGMSLDGGLTFNPATPIETYEPCESIHGHLKVSPVDGTTYVPIPLCGDGTQLSGTDRTGVSVSGNGVTWSPQAILGTGTQYESDPSVGIGANGTVYECFQNGDGRLGIVVSHDKGASWSASVDPAAGLGIRNVQFPAAVAGDDERAACAFLGTTTAGDDQLSAFAGVWRLYVSYTYDSGATWTTVDVTGTDPVQKGCISLAGVLGGGCSKRNLLDFNDAAVTLDGRVVVAYADGCVNTCVTGTGASSSAVLTLAVQTGGKGLFRAYD
jgi:hypothetical protein